MKRDMDLCRKILIEVEKRPTTTESDLVVIEGYSTGEVGHNAWLLNQGGLLEGIDVTGAGDSVDLFAPRCLTYQGHDFLEHARDDTRWKTAKDMLASIGGAATLQAMKTTLEAVTKAGLDALAKAGNGPLTSILLL